jgi:glucose dehydrogenase
VALVLAIRFRKNSYMRYAVSIHFVVAAGVLVYGQILRRDDRQRIDEKVRRQAVVPANEPKSGAFGEDRSPQVNAPYELFRHPILDHDGLSCAPTPWGTITGLNLQTGKIAWEQPHGTQVQDHQTGSVSLGGVMVTAGGLLFSAGTREPLLRAYDAATGEELWKGDLPVPAQATPMTYQVHGRQFVVIAAGGSGLWGTEQGDAVVAFALK